MEVKNLQMNWMVLEACGQQVMVVLINDFSDRQFRAEFGNEALVSSKVAIGLDHRGTLKETLKYMSEHGMFLGIDFITNN